VVSVVVIYYASIATLYSSRL